MAVSLIEEAKQGYDAEPGSQCPYYASSNSGMAWLAGQWLKARGRNRPMKAAASRGYRVRVDDVLLDVGNATSIVELRP